MSYRNKYVIKTPGEPNVKQVYLKLDDINGTCYIIVNDVYVAYLSAEGKLGRCDTARLPNGLCKDKNCPGFIALDN